MAAVAYDYGHDVSETDYGYGDTQNTDYGYSNQNMDYDYAYGDQNITTDYGYEENTADYGYDSQPSGTDYGYGDPEPSNIDMDYGDSKPAEPAKPEPKARRPRRRCSVTKYSLEETAQAGSAEAEMVKNLHAAEMMQKFRQGL